LQRLHDEAPPDHFTLGWLMGSLQKRLADRMPISPRQMNQFRGRDLV
jgi:hypothetical protein